MKSEAFCRWYEKPLRDVAEVQQEQCEENGQQCDGCPDLILREKRCKHGRNEDEEIKRRQNDIHVLRRVE